MLLSILKIINNLLQKIFNIICIGLTNFRVANHLVSQIIYVVNKNMQEL